MKHSAGSRENGMRRCPTFQWALDRIKGVSPPHVWYLITCTPSRFRRLNTNPNPNHLFHSTDGNTRKQKVIPEDDALLNCNLHGSSAIGCLCVLDAPSSRRHRTAGLISLLLCQPPTSQPRNQPPALKLGVSTLKLLCTLVSVCTKLYVMNSLWVGQVRMTLLIKISRNTQTARKWCNKPRLYVMVKARQASGGLSERTRV